MKIINILFAAVLLFGVITHADMGVVGIEDSVVVVRRGESLSRIAARLFLSGNFDQVDDLISWIRRHNDLVGDRLVPGQTLRVPLSPRQLCDPDPIHEARGVYVNAVAAGSNYLDDLADQLVNAGGNTIVFDVKDRAGTLSYRSGVVLAVTSGASRAATVSNPDLTIEKLHQKGLHVVARLTCFYDQHLAAKHPELRPRSRDGGLWPSGKKPGWLDPSLPVVQDYLIDLVVEVATMGVDEVQLDYVRFPTEGDISAAVYSVDTSTTTKPTIITHFVRRVRDALDGKVLLSADIFGVVAWGREVDIENTGQKLDELLPLIDVVSPMLYPSHFYGSFHHVDNPVAYPYYMVYQTCRQLLPQAEHHGVGVRPWVQAFPYRIPNFDVTFVEEQLRAVEDCGVKGWLLWNPSSRYTEGLPAIRRVVAGIKPDPLVVDARNPHRVTDSDGKRMAD